jgi:signal transduction histidine kinase
LRRRFILILVAFSAVVSAMGGTVAYRTASLALERELDQKLFQVAGAVAETGLQAEAEILSLQPGDEASPTFLSVQQQLQRLKRFMDEAFILRSTDLTSLVTSLDGDEVPVGTVLREFAPYTAEIQEAMVWGQSTSPLYFLEPEGRYYKYGFVRLEQTDAILAVRGPADYMQALTDFRWAMVRGSLLAAVVAVLIAWFLATTVARPLDRLGRVALRIQRGRMDEPVREEKGGELGRLSRAMERMRAGILNRDEQLRLMLAQVAHEIRNPLGGLELFAAAAADTLDAEERGRLLAKVRSEILALNRIIDDFLTFARPLRVEGVLHDVRGPVREAAELMEGQMKGGGGRLSVDLPQDPLLAQADPEHVKRVTLNLLRNAAEAGEHVRLSCESVRGEAVISVADDGPGIPGDLADRIFEPFVTDKEKGAGLGLAIVKRVVEGNGGRVELRGGGSAPGEGAEFRVYFRGGEDLSPGDVGDQVWRKS